MAECLCETQACTPSLHYNSMTRGGYILKDQTNKSYQSSEIAVSCQSWADFNQFYTDLMTREGLDADFIPQL